VAQWNPFSFIVEAIRDPVITVFSAEAFAQGMASIAFLAALGLGLSALGLRHHLRAG
jgi:hypothetical protein